MSEREPNVEAATQAAEASAAGLGTEPPSRSESVATYWQWVKSAPPGALFVTFFIAELAGVATLYIAQAITG